MDYETKRLIVDVCRVTIAITGTLFVVFCMVTVAVLVICNLYEAFKENENDVD